MKKLLISLLFLAYSGCSVNEDIKPSTVNILYGTADTTHTGVVYINLNGAGCSGTLIAPDVVLTAAHCVVSPSSMSVHFGNSEPFDASRGVIEARVHPDWTGDTTDDLSNDIALLRLDSPAPPQAQIVAPLPSSQGLTLTDIDVTDLEFVGYGVTETGSSGTRLRMDQTLRYLCDAGGTYCNIDVPVGSDNYELLIPPGSLGIHMNNSGGICHGDSGGPAFVMRNGTEYVAGVNSFVIHNSSDECDYFGAATRVAQFEDFINDFLHPEICDNGIDDNGNGDVDCDDAYCDASAECIPNACDNPTVINCDTSVTATTAGEFSVYDYYNPTCTSGFEIQGPEKVYALLIPQGTDVRIDLELSAQDQDLELLLLSGSCNQLSCIAASTNSPGNNEELQFTTDGNPFYIMVDTWQNAGNFTLTVTCSEINPSEEICSNLIDDDLDGDTDCDDDDCTSDAACNPSIENCTNGVDDDGDGDIDCDDADCNTHPACQTTTENCANGVDDDGDGDIDCDDADCIAHSSCMVGSENCTNGLDDDGDGAVDCMDSDCSNAANCNSLSEVCDNEIDDDLDGAVDCDDIDCALSCGIQPSEICDNNIDDNGNGKIDCNDPACLTSSSCLHPREDCTNGADDDGDGKIDCDDADCHTHTSCPEVDGEFCLDGLDNDGDGKIDCDDEDCQSHFYCNVTKNTDYKSPSGCSCNSAGQNTSNPVYYVFLLFSLLFISRRLMLF